MRTFRPSGKAVVVAGALAVTLVVGATSGAVAGRLITSQDIQDGTIHSRDLGENSVKIKNIGHGQVNWQKSLSVPTKKRIMALVQAGPQGEPGPAGPSGAPGAAGPPGAPGAPGTSLTDWDFFGGSGWAYDPVDGVDFTEIRGWNDDELTLPSAGTYLITVRGVLLDLGGGPGDFPFIYLGTPLADNGDPDLHTYTGDCDLSLTALLGDLAGCSSTFTYVADGPGPLPLRILGDYGDCAREDVGEPGCEVSPFYAQVTAYRMSGQTPDLAGLPEVPPCGCPRGDGRRLDHLRHELRHSVAKLG